ncbi:GntR family transcriptional regulator [Streptomyces sp. ISL-94]|uniref:GntR family transcriptional regulator n=1 Tax=Streptomyces sp. ISL-94 TaxID=2819190 RepID=UPI001BE7BE6B|nr:GntR family transcriptional regulator [Streptomyces sp. ISL-94]MBT2477185.1 GntR family transcriptional regulator [Streptomyces sp. ISL-94]
MDSRAEDWADELARLGWSSKAEHVARILRKRIAEGKHLPDDRLSEEEISKGVKVSRNTLREAFRLLAHEGLVEHRLNQGVFVRKLSLIDVVDLYRLRRVVQPAVIRDLKGREVDLSRVRAAVVAADAAGSAADWRVLGTANLHFHQALTALAGSTRLDALMSRVLAELRLVFYAVPDLREFHVAYRARNGKILELIAVGEYVKAANAMTAYLRDAERDLVDRYREAAG